MRDSMNESASEATPKIFVGDQCRTKDSVIDEGRRAATAFQNIGLQEGDAIALLLRNDFPAISASIGAQLIGAYPVPINWHYRADEVRHILTDSKARALVVHADLLPEIKSALPPELPVIVAGADAKDTVPMLHAGAQDWGSFCDGKLPHPGDFHRARSSMIYTSGTTGAPKGVCRELPTEEQHAEFSKLSQEAYRIRPGMRSLITGPLYHALPNMAMRHALRLAQDLVIHSRFDPEKFLQAVAAHRITHTVVVPTMFVRLLNLPEAIKDRYDVSSLESVTHTAAPCPVEVKERMIDWFGPVINEVYGGTELGCVAHCSSQEWLSNRGTVGKLARGTALQILDETGLPLPDGEIGEIYARNSCFADFTYHGDPQKRIAAERNGLISLGDMGYVKNGFLYICDRRSDMVISGGVNIYPAEIEAALLSHDQVADCAVFGIPNDDLGESVCAAVQLKDGVESSAEDLLEFLSRKIAKYKLPRKVDFHPSLPREDSGKIFKKKLKAPYWASSGRAI